MLKCPSCATGKLLSDTVDYSIGDTLVRKVPALICTCGEIVLAEDVLSQLMAYIQDDNHLTEIEWGNINAFSGRKADEYSPKF